VRERCKTIQGDPDAELSREAEETERRHSGCVNGALLIQPLDDVAPLGIDQRESQHGAEPERDATGGRVTPVGVPGPKRKLAARPVTPPRDLRQKYVRDEAHPQMAERERIEPNPQAWGRAWQESEVDTLLDTEPIPVDRLDPRRCGAGT